MPITLQIPDSVASGMRLPEGEIERRLRTELAIALYGQGILSFGKASELASVGRFQFADLLDQRSIGRHYEADELAEDISYARSDDPKG